MIGWAGTEPALREAIFGGEATLFHTPWPNWATGFFYEEGLYNFYNDKRHSGGRFYLRKRLLESSSFIVDDPVFYEFYYGLGNEFWPGDDGRPVNTYLGAVGARYRQNTPVPLLGPGPGRALRRRRRVRQRAPGFEARLRPRRRPSTGWSARSPSRGASSPTAGSPSGPTGAIVARLGAPVPPGRRPAAPRPRPDLARRDPRSG